MLAGDHLAASQRCLRAAEEGLCCLLLRRVQGWLVACLVAQLLLAGHSIVLGVCMAPDCPHACDIGSPKAPCPSPLPKTHAADSDIAYAIKPAWDSYLAYIEAAEADGSFQTEGGGGRRAGW